MALNPGKPLTFLVYRSAMLCGEAGFEEILRASRANNARHGLTGVLMHDRRHFLQMLEGPHDAVGATVLRIASDPRHRDMHLLASEQVDFRLFSNWSMQSFVCSDGRATLASRLSTADALGPAGRAEMFRAFAITEIG